MRLSPALLGELTTPVGKWMSLDYKIARRARIRGKVLFEPPFTIYEALHIWSDIRIGAYTYFRSGLVRHLKSIGRYCSVANGFLCGEPEHPTNWLSTSPMQYDMRKFSYHLGDHPVLPDFGGHLNPPVIGNDVWICSNVTILQNVRIGDGDIIAAGAVVAGNVEPYTVVGCIPARPIRHRFPDNTVRRLLDLRWWQFDRRDLFDVPFTDPTAAMDEIERRRDEGIIFPRKEHFQALKVESISN